MRVTYVCNDIFLRNTHGESRRLTDPHTYIQGAGNKVSSKLRKIERKTDILFTKIYL